MWKNRPVWLYYFKPQTNLPRNRCMDLLSAGGGSLFSLLWLHHAWELCSNEGFALCVVEGGRERGGCSGATNRTGLKKKKPSVSNITCGEKHCFLPLDPPPPLPVVLETHTFHTAVCVFTCVSQDGNPKVSLGHRKRREKGGCPLEQLLELKATTMDCVFAGGSHALSGAVRTHGTVAF